MRFLIVDDEKMFRKIIFNVILQLGNAKEDIVEAEDGLQAWEILQKEEKEFDVILTDWNMANMNGIELTKKIRKDNRFKGIPIIMITSQGYTDDIKEAVNVGVNNYIKKPFTSKILKERLDLIFDDDL